MRYFENYCTGCGNNAVRERGSICSRCKKKTDQWPHKRFNEGDFVNTPKGIGQIVGIDLPHSPSVWRWKVKMNSSPQDILCFFDKEVKEKD